MQFLVYDPTYVPDPNAPPPTPELMDTMDKFITEATQAGVIVTTGNLQSQATRLSLDNGKFTITDGPYIELKELLGGFAVLNVNSLEEAIEWSKRFLSIFGKGQSEIVRLFVPEDFG